MYDTNTKAYAMTQKERMYMQVDEREERETS